MAEGLGRGGRAKMLMEALKEEKCLRPGGLTDLDKALPQLQLGRGVTRASLVADHGDSVFRSSILAPSSSRVGALSSAEASSAHQHNAVGQQKPEEVLEKSVLVAGSMSIVAKPGGGRGTMLAAAMESAGPKKESSTGVSPLESPASTSRHLPPPINVDPGKPVSTPALSITPVSTVSDDGDGSHASVASRTEPALPKDNDVKKIKGTLGRPQPIVANYVRLRCKNRCWYQYAVTFKPELDSRSLRCRLLYEHAQIGRARIFDGSILYLPAELPKKHSVYHATRESDGKPIVMEVTFTNSISCGDRAIIHAFNVLFKRIQNILKLQAIGRNYYDPKLSVMVPQHKLEVWPGFVTSINEHEGGLLLVCDVTHRVLRTDTVYQFMQSLYQRTKPGESFQDSCLKALVGSVVLTRYNNKTYRIDDIDFKQNPESTFDLRGEPRSYLSYYEEHYQVKIKYKDQPLLVSRPKLKERDGETMNIYLVPELCSMTGLTDEIRQDFKVMKDLAVHTRITPAQRSLAMKRYVNRINTDPEAQALLSDWRVEVESLAVQLDARVSDPEVILFRDSQVPLRGDASWLKDLGRNSTVTGVHLTDWLLIHSSKDAQYATTFVSKYRQCAPPMGLEVNVPVCVPVTDDRTESYVRAIKDNLKPYTKFVVVILPTRRDDRYNALKKYLSVECGMPSQVIIARTLNQPQKLTSIVQKIALQINAKLGGELWALHIPMKSVMVVGIDVYHDKSGSSESVAAMVASLNSTLTRYYSRVCIQGRREELISALLPCFTAALTKYHEVNRSLPEKIIVYRDGVGDGMLPVVAEYEKDQLVNTFRTFQPDYNPRVAIVVVQKRINTRLFAKEGEGDANLVNAPPGTIVDHTVTRKDHYDFFLVSQHVTQGTVSPTHYVIVYNETLLKPDHMQKLAYKMCHLYYNWPGTIRVPAPCQYAHKLAYLVGQNLGKRAPNEALSELLHYL